MPAANNMVSQLTVENSGSSSSFPSLIRPCRESASQKHRINMTLTVSMMNQPRLRNMIPTIDAAKLASPSVSTMPHTATAPVNERATISREFLNMCCLLVEPR